MKKLIGKDIGSYRFDALNKQITFFDVSFSLEQILTITNTTDGILVYVFADSTLTGSLDNNVLTLQYNTNTMSDDDHLQIYIDIPEIVKDESYCEIDLIDDPVVLLTENIEDLFGNQYLKGQSGGIKVEDQFFDTTISGSIITAQSQIGANFNGKSVAVVQISGTWAGTLTFEATANIGDWIAINGIALAGTVGVSTTTANGIFRFNVTGLVGLRVRYTTYTSGQPIVTINTSSASVGTQPPAAGIVVQGSQTQNLSQKATSYELNTYDTNLVTVLGTGTVVSPQAKPLPVVPVADTLNAGAKGNMFNVFPDIFPRVRVESAGSERQPFAQEKYTNKLQITNDEEIIILKNILSQLEVLNCLALQWIDKNGFPNLQLPEDYEDILTKRNQRRN